MDRPIRIVIVAPRGLLRDALRQVLGREVDLLVVGEADSPAQAADLVGSLQPSVALLCSGLLTGNCDLLDEFQGKSPDTKTLLINSTLKEDLLPGVLRRGAWGHLGVDASVSDLVKAIRAVHRGEVWLARTVVARVLVSRAASPNDPHRAPALTEREREILGMLTRGGANKDIARALGLSEKTVKNHLTTIFRKVGVASRLEALLYATAHDIAPKPGA